MTTLQVYYLKNFFDKSLGYYKYSKESALYLRTRFGIHTFGMQFPIDVVVLDNDNIVVKLVENLSPNKVFFWPFSFDKVIELPKGEIERKKISLGISIKLEILPNKP